MVQAAMDTGLVRLVGRMYNPGDLPRIDAVIVGSETPWLTGRLIRRWRRTGLRVIGLFPPGDRAAIEMFCRSEVDQLFADTAEPIIVLRAVRDLIAMHHLLRTT